MSLTIEDLTQPAPPGVLVGNPGAAPAAGSWLDKLLQMAQTLGLPTTAWQPGQPTRTIFAVASIAMAQSDVLQTMANAGGFLDFAATGTVPVVDIQGNTTQVPVSVDPSTVTPTPVTSVSWIDATAHEFFDVDRISASYASGVLTIVNASGSTYNLGAGQYHVANPTTGATYKNRDAISITASSTITAVMVADLIGPASSSAAHAVTQPVTVLLGVTIDNAVAWVGDNWETNVALAARCRLKLASLSPNGAAAAYEYVALTAIQLLPPPVTLVGGAITRALVQSDKFTGHVLVTLANASGPVAGVVQLAVIGVASAGGVVEVQTASAHGLATGNFATVSGVIGVAAANTTSTITVTAADKFKLDGTTFAGAYVSGGVVEGGDLGEIDALINATVVPNAITEITQSATAQVINVVVEIFVPSTSLGAATAAVQTALAAYIATVPIGGFTDPGGAFTQVLPFDAVIGVVYGAIAPFGGQQVTGTVNGGTSNISLAPQLVATLGTVTVHGHGV